MFSINSIIIFFFFLLLGNMEPAKRFDQTESKLFLATDTISNKSTEAKKKKLVINERFILNSSIPVGTFYRTYKGIDLVSRKYVTVYIKPNSKDKVYSKNLKEQLREKISPPIKWSGVEKIDKNLFDVEVYARFGPSLDQIMHNYKKKVSESTLYLLSYHLLKLIDKIDSSGYVHRSISVKNIVCSQSYQRNQLFFLNIFDIERKNEQPSLTYDIRYCSLATHLKLKSCSKDTLESMCYCLMDFYLKGMLFDSRVGTQRDYIQKKTILNPEGIPNVFLEFFQYVRNLNHGQQTKLTEWKMKFKKMVSQSLHDKPYEWINKRQKTDDLSQNESKFACESFVNIFTASLGKGLKKEKRAVEQELELESDKLQIEEGQLNNEGMQQKQIIARSKLQFD